jgi:hypothetical protein
MVRWIRKWCITTGCLLLAACNSPKLDQNSVSPGQPITPVEAGTLQLLSRQALVYNGTGTPWKKELLTQQSFENFNPEKAKEPLWSHLGWHIAPPEAALTTKLIAQDSALPALELTKSAHDVYVQQNTHELGKMPIGTWLIATATCKSSTPDTLAVAIDLKAAEDIWRLAEAHPGDGQWHDVSVSIPITNEMGAQAFTAGFVKKAGSEMPALLQQINLRFDSTPPVGLRAQSPGELIANGDFESYAALGIPYPWRKDAWNSVNKPVIGGDAHTIAAPPGASGTRAVFLVPANQDSVIRISQRIAGLTNNDLGAQLVARAKAISGHPADLWFQLVCVNGYQEIQGHATAVSHPGDNQWHDLTASITIPKDKLPDVVMVGVFRRAYSKAPAMVDAVSVTRIGR